MAKKDCKVRIDLSGGCDSKRAKVDVNEKSRWCPQNHMLLQMKSGPFRMFCVEMQIECYCQEIFHCYHQQISGLTYG